MKPTSKQGGPPQNLTAGALEQSGTPCVVRLITCLHSLKRFCYLGQRRVGTREKPRTVAWQALCVPALGRATQEAQRDSWLHPHRPGKPARFPALGRATQGAPVVP